MSLATPGQPVAAQPHDLLSYEEFLDGRYEGEHVEWVQGKVVPMAPVSDEHTDLSVFLVAILTFFIHGKDLGRVRQDPFQMKTGPDLPGRAPDISIVRKENQSRLKKTHLDGPADLVVEIISPDSRSRDRGEKYYEYEQGGVSEYWLIDPERRQAEFYQLGTDRFYHLVAPSPEGVYRSSAFPGLWIKTDWLWTRPAPVEVLRAWGVI